MFSVKKQYTKNSAESNSDFFNAVSDGFAVIKILYNNKDVPYDFSICSLKGTEQDNKLSFIEKNTINNNNIFNQTLTNFHLTIKEEKSITFNYYSIIDNKDYELKTLPIGENNRLVVLYNDITHYQKTLRLSKRIKKITKIISATSDLIQNENNIDKLLNRACEIIVNLSDSKLVWITSFEKNNTSPSSFYFSDEYVLSKYTEHVPVFPCIMYIIENSTSKAYDFPDQECSECFLHKDYKRQTHLVLPMQYKNVLYGVLCIALNHQDELEPEEKELYHNLSSNLAFAIHNIQLNKNLEKVHERLNVYSSKIEKQNKELQKLNSELKLKNEQLLANSDIKDESERLKANFLANISHEIRTPLNGILGFAQLIKSAKYSYEKIHEYIDIISYSSNLLMGTIDNILDISKLQSGEMDLHITKVNIKEMFGNVSEYNKLSLDKRENIALKLKLSELSKGFELFTDEKKLKQIINVLIHNAYKFTNQGYIELGVYEKDEQVIFYVKDTGVGIERDMFNIIFKNFRQIDESSTREYGGIGLGLSIAKGLVNLLGGEIWLDSTVRANENINGGTTFYFSIPYKTDQDNEKTKRIMDLDKIEKIDWSSKKILIVEDDDFSIEYLTEALEYTNVELVYAKTGNDAVDKVKNIPDLDVILMDIQLPGLSGDKATRAIREFNIEIPIIAQTAHAMVNDKENYLQAGCTDYISKPIAVKDLFSILCKYI